MKARYVDLPYEKLPHGLNFPELWPQKRGQCVHISAIPLNEGLGLPMCAGPYFEILSPQWPHLTCIHMIELDESALDGEVTAIAQELKVSQ